MGLKEHTVRTVHTLENKTKIHRQILALQAIVYHFVKVCSTATNELNQILMVNKPSA